MTAHKLLMQLIQGKGHTNFWWEVAEYSGNDGTQTQASFDTYAEALIYKLTQKDNKDLFIDLWHKRNDYATPEWVGEIDGNNHFALLKQLPKFL